MNAIAAEVHRNYNDQKVWEQLPPSGDTGLSLNEIAIASGLPRRGSVESALQRLLRAEVAVRKWNGNQRFGRYLYWLAQDQV